MPFPKKIAKGELFREDVSLLSCSNFQTFFPQNNFCDLYGTCYHCFLSNKHHKRLMCNMEKRLKLIK